MEFTLRQTLEIAPTDGLDGSRGIVKIVGLVDFIGLPSNVDTDAWTQGLDETEVLDFTQAVWVGFKYLAKEDNDLWGVTYLPDFLFQSMVDEAKLDVRLSRLTDMQLLIRFQTIMEKIAGNPTDDQQYQAVMAEVQRRQGIRNTL